MILKFHFAIAVFLTRYVFIRTGVVAPNMGVYIPIAWHSVTTLSLLWFLHTFKRNFICIAGKEGNLIGKEWISLLIRFFQLDSWLLDCLVAEAAGVSVESLLTVSGAGGNRLEQLDIYMHYSTQYENF